MTQSGTFELELSRFIRAPRERVFDAFTTAGALSAWHCPRGMTVAEASADARVGGRYRVVMKHRDGSTPTAVGVYREIRRPEFLSYTWCWEGERGAPAQESPTLIEVRLSAKDGGTELRMRHSGFVDVSARDGHRAGWQSVLNRLADLVDERGTAASLVLYGSPRSTFTRTARMALAEKGLAYTHVPSAPHTPEVLAINPFGRIPALRDGDTTLYETAAIVRYIDESFDGPPLFPLRGVSDRARCEQWVSLVVGHLFDAMIRRYVLQFVFPKGPEGKPDRAIIDGAISEMDRQFAALDTAFATSDFLVGGQLTAADLFVAPILAAVETFPEGKRLLEARHNVRRAQAAIRARPSFAATQATEA
ncbi:MAG TPA: SRPBCC domain-containing protein [Burkholderiaceae bacterium]|nr:SRPBCC domain-containing protein [Burkholderiaceae bacterium]